MCSQRLQSTPSHHLFPGLVLLATGVVFLLDRLHVIEIGSVWRLWPGVLVIIGIQNILTRENLGWGVGLILLGGTYFLLNFGVMGLGWENGWPLILVAVGLGFIVGSFQRAGAEVTHEKK